MAYTVGSVSVEVVPDFRNAQNAITAFFNSQPDQLKVPVRPDFDERSVQAVEREAARVGSRVGEAISQNASRSLNRDLTGQLSRQVSTLERDIAKARKDGEAASKALQVAELRLDEARRAGNRSASTMLSLEQAVERQRGRVADSDRVVAEGTARLVALRQQYAQAVAEASEEAARRAVEAQRKADKASIESAHATAIRMNAEFDRRVAAAQRAADRQAQIDKRSTDKAIAEAERRAAQELRILERSIDQQNRAAEKASRERERAAVREAQSALRAAQAAAKASARVQLEVDVDERRAIAAGRRTGGLVTRAMREEIHQNAGLIAAVIAGTILFGGPAALAAATAVFGGLGAVAAAQSENVRRAWVGTWAGIKSSAISDAGVLIPTFERMAVSIGRSFENIRPQLRDIFTEVGPQLESFTASLGETAENVMPGLVAAIRAGEPVIHGLGDLLEDIGSGLSSFFATLAQHAPAAGSAFAQLGDSMAELLPTLGELLGQGAELASTTLPALTAALSALHAVTSALGPALPPVLAGYLAFRALKGVGSFVTNFGIKLDEAGRAGGRFAGLQSRVGSALRGLGSSLPVVGIGVGLVAAAMSEATAVSQGWARALTEGGRAARTAAIEMQSLEDFWSGRNTGGLGQFLAGFEGLASAFGLGADAANDARKAMLDYFDSLDPISEAQLLVSRASNDMALALEKPEAVFGGVEGASRRLSAAQRDLKNAQDDLARATQGVTEAMVAQGEQARALADSSFAYEKSLNDLEDAQADYNTALAEGNEEEKSRALLDLQMAYGNVANAARDMALDALPATLDAQQASIIADKAQLDALLALREQYGDLGPILNNQIAELQASTGAANGNMLAQAQLAAALEQVGIAVNTIPGEKSVVIEVPTADQKQRLIDLGFTVETLEDGSIRVTAETEEAQANLDLIDTELAGLDGATAVPVVDLNPIPFFGDLDTVLDDLAGLDSQNPTPTADLNTGPFRTNWNVADDLVGDLAGRRPTPIAALNNVPLLGAAATAIGALNNVGRQNPTPTISARDSATPIIGSILSQLNRLTDRTIAVTTVYRTIGSIPLFGGVGGASGGAIEAGRIHAKYDIGGAIVGRGGPLDDLVPFRGPDPSIQYSAANGEHILDGRDVAMMGGQAGVYAFRELLNSGKLGGPGGTFDVRRVVAASSPERRQVSAPSPREVKIYTSDNPRPIIRALRDYEHQEAVLTSVWP